MLDGEPCTYNMQSGSKTVFQKALFYCYQSVLCATFSHLVLHAGELGGHIQSIQYILLVLKVKYFCLLFLFSLVLFIVHGF